VTASGLHGGPKIGLFGPMKSLDSAEHGLERLEDGRWRAWIRHQDMPGVTPEMLVWWFRNIDTFTRFNGRDFLGPPVPVYRMWHPYDHISVRWVRRVQDGAGRLVAGSVIGIEENLGARHPVRAKARVTKFDTSEFNFDMMLGGRVPVGFLLHEYAAVRGGCSFYTEMVVGTDVSLVAPLVNPLVRRFAATEEFMRAWILHNIEESGETEKFVPRLYEHAIASRASGAGI